MERERGSGCGEERGSCDRDNMWRERGVVAMEEREGVTVTVIRGSYSDGNKRKLISVRKR